MGRQLNYYISPKQCDNFLKNALDSGYIIFVPHAYEENGDILYDCRIHMLEFYDSYDEFSKVQQSHRRKVYLYRKEWGDIIKQSQSDLWDPFRSPYIEYCRCFIHEKGFLSRGRIYLTTYYKDEIINYSIVNKHFQSLVRKMRKEVKYKGYKFKNGKKTSEYISQEAVDIIESGGYVPGM